MNSHLQKSSTKQKSNLNAKHKAFADKYLEDPERNARKAYKAVYGRKVKDAAADAASSRLLKNVKVRNYIDVIEERTTDKVELSVEWTKAKLKRFAESKITDYFNIKKGNIYLKDLHKLPPEAIDCIQEISETKEGIRIKLVDKKSSVTDIARILGLFDDKLSLSGKVDASIQSNTFVVPAFVDFDSIPDMNEQGRTNS